MEVLQPRAAHLDAMPQVNKAAFSGTEGVYMLPHHVQEIDRLRRQHWFMKGTTDGALLVSKLPSDQKTLRVLDSGCADGMSFCTLFACNVTPMKLWSQVSHLENSRP